MRSNLAENLQPDPRINLAIGVRLKGRDCKLLKNRSGYWDNLLSDVFSPTALKFTRSQYLAKTDEERDDIKKNLPYFVGGPTEGLRGDKRYLQARSFITIDIDSAPSGVLGVVQENLEKLGITALIHQSLNHSEDAPRIRVIVPLLYELDPDDYSLASRILASKLLPGLEGVDSCSFKASQVMLLPVHCIDDDPVWIVTSGDFYDAIQELQDWQGEIPQTPSECSAMKKAVSSRSGKESAWPAQKGVPQGAGCPAHGVVYILDYRTLIVTWDRALKFPTPREGCVPVDREAANRGTPSPGPADGAAPDREPGHVGVAASFT